MFADYADLPYCPELCFSLLSLTLLPEGSSDSPRCARCLIPSLPWGLDINTTSPMMIPTTLVVLKLLPWSLDSTAIHLLVYSPPGSLNTQGWAVFGYGSARH